MLREAGVSQLDWLGVPRCALCQRPVDELVSWFDVMRREWVFVAKCHGQTERVVVPEELLVAAMRGVSLGDAFRGAPELPTRSA